MNNNPLHAEEQVIYLNNISNNTGVYIFKLLHNPSRLQQ